VLLSLDGTLVVQLINFLVFLVVLNAIFLKPVGAAIAKRRAFIDGVARDIEQYEADLKLLRSQAEDRRAAARREADVLIGRARSQGQAEAASIGADFTARAAQLTAEAQAAVAHEIEQARQNEQQIVDSLADTLLSRALGPAVAA
jgi:F-type H+-transporting ATPase subunit b